jgi:fermentation-respiration switch protein FrsA (DUF1100 family)
MERQDFIFESGGEEVMGSLFLPLDQPVAAVVTTGPLTSVKEQAAGAYAHALAARGFATLAFDHRYFGQSGGRPRQFENPEAKVEDIRNAASALENDKRTRGLPVAAVGICAGGGYMAVAVARESRFRVFAGIAGVYSDATVTRQWLGDRYDAAIARARSAEESWRKTGIAETIPAVAPDGGDVAMPLREAYEFYGTTRGAVPNYVNGFAVQSRAYTLPFDALAAAPAIKVPTLIVHSEKALTPDLAHKFYGALGAPKEELWLKSQGQIDFYDDPQLIDPVSDAVVGFFRRVL